MIFIPKKREGIISKKSFFLLVLYSLYCQPSQNKENKFVVQICRNLESLKIDRN